VLRPSAKNFLKQVEIAVQMGRSLLVENVGDTLDAALDALLGRQLRRSGGSLCVRIGDVDVEYSSGFNLYLTSKLPNPHYSPEVCSRVCVINFTITPDGLVDQLLCVTVEKERSELEAERQGLILSTTMLQGQLMELELEVLRLLSEATGDVLEDDVLIQTLSQSKVASGEVAAALKQASVTESRINDTRVLSVPPPNFITGFAC